MLHLGAPLLAEIKSQLLLRLGALWHRKAVAVLVVVRFVFHCGSAHYRRSADELRKRLPMPRMRASPRPNVNSSSQKDRGVSAGEVGEGEGPAEEGSIAW